MLNFVSTRVVTDTAREDLSTVPTGSYHAGEVSLCEGEVTTTLLNKPLVAHSLCGQKTTAEFVGCPGILDQPV